jgi:hypothetical protein
MASLIDLLQSGQLSPGSPDLQDPIEQLKALLARQQGGGAVAGTAGDANVLGSSVAAPSFGSLAPSAGSLPPIPDGAVPPKITGAGVPYAPPAPPATAAPAAAPRQPAPSVAFPTNEEGLPIGDKVMAFLSGLSGEGGLKTMREQDKARQTENLTIKTLMERGIANSPEEAKAITRNPASLQAALLSIFAPKGFNLKADEKRFMPGASPTAPAIEVATGADPEKVVAPGAALVKNGKPVFQNTPKPPPGYQWKEPSDPTQGTVPIPGGPADEKFQQTQRTDKTALESTIANISQAQADARALIAHGGLGSNFGIMGKLPNVPGQGGASAEAALKQFRARAGFQALQAMRDASKTGGALGNVSNQEGQRLENSAAALDGAQSVEDAKDRLQKYIDEAEGAKQRAVAAYRRAYGEADTRMTPQGRGGANDGWTDLGGGVRIRERP